MNETTPPMPTSQDEWEVHWAFYSITVQQRDAAWREIEHLQQALQKVASHVSTVKGIYRRESDEWAPLYERNES